MWVTDITDIIDNLYILGSKGSLLPFEAVGEACPFGQARSVPGNLPDGRVKLMDRRATGRSPMAAVGVATVTSRERQDGFVPAASMFF